MSGSIKEISAWEASDGRVFSYREDAENHQQRINAAKVANDELAKGSTIATCLRAAGYAGTIDPILERVTRDTKLVIPHWQCKDIPGYSPMRFEYGLSMRVGGDVGSWMGPYASSVSISELVQCASDKRTVFNEQ